MKVINPNKQRSNILIIDALNLFLRNFTVNPSLGVNGNPVGGSRGFLLSLQKYIVDFKVDVVYIVWDGPGGSQKRREIVKEYKAGRKPIKMNNILDLTQEDQDKNKLWQQLRLTEYLNQTAFFQFMIQGVEADDVIAYLKHLHPSDNTIIVSNDQDFYQLCEGRTILYRPAKKKFYTEKKVVEEFGIHPTNMALARAIAGDSSDNLKGVPRVGLKTVAKRFKTFADKKTLSIDSLMTECQNANSKLKLYPSILSHRKSVEVNYRLMQLYVPSISESDKEEIKKSLLEHNFDFDFGKFRRLHNEDGIFDNFENLEFSQVKMSKLRISE